MLEHAGFDTNVNDRREKIGVARIERKVFEVSLRVVLVRQAGDDVIAQELAL